MIVNKILHKNIADLNEIERVDLDIKTFLVSIIGTIPGSRGFGVTGDFVDLNNPQAVNQLAVELDEGVDKYIREVSVTALAPSIDHMTGQTGLEISVERREE